MLHFVKPLLQKIVSVWGFLRNFAEVLFFTFYDEKDCYYRLVAQHVLACGNSPKSDYRPPVHRRPHGACVQWKGLSLSFARHLPTGRTATGLVLHGRLPRVLVGEPHRLDRSRCDCHPEQSSLGEAKLLFHVGTRLRRAQW